MLYLENGYCNIRYLIEKRFPMTIIIGGRGTGKTFGALDYLRETGTPFMLMRRTQTEIDMINKPDFSPFKSINVLRGTFIEPRMISGKTAGFYEIDPESGEPVGSLLGMTAALSTISSIRGFDASNIKLLLFDEFIPEKHCRPIRDEGLAILNAIETVNRNRELSGSAPLQSVFLSNSNDIASPLLMQLNLVNRLVRMRETKTELWQDEKRGILLCYLQKSRISDAKRNTALYRLTANESFEKMSLENDFNVSGRTIKSKPIREYNPIVTIGEITIYEHKSTCDLYCSPHASGGVPVYTMSDADKTRFRSRFRGIVLAALDDAITYENTACALLLDNIIGL